GVWRRRGRASGKSSSRDGRGSGRRSRAEGEGPMFSPSEPTAQVEAREAAAIARTYARSPFHPRRGRGARLFDAEGRAYWDLLAGIAVSALGHGHPRLRRALREASQGVWHV